MQFSAVILAGLFFLCSPVFAEFVIITTTYRIQTSFKKAGDVRLLYKTPHTRVILTNINF